MLDGIQLVAIAGIGAAGLMTTLWRGAASRAAAQSEANRGLKEKLASVESSFDKEQKARRRQSKELAEYRKRADKSKRRGVRHAPQPMGTASRIQDLEEARARLGHERDRACSERDDLVLELSLLQRQIEADAKDREAVVATAKPEAELEAQLAEARERIGKLESEKRMARSNEARARKRMDNQDQLYASLRSELEVKKDRLRTQEERLQRLQALKVAVID